MSALSRAASNFENDPRRQQEKRGRKPADQIYKHIFGGINIERFDDEERHILDKEFAIDVKIIFPNGMILTGQEKFLSYKYRERGTLTVEFEQNLKFDHEPGDWFKLASQFYFTGYLNEDETDFDPWVIADWPRLVLATQNNTALWQENINKDGKAKASFRYTRIASLPGDCVIAKSDNSETINMTRQQITFAEDKWLSEEDQKFIDNIPY